MKDIEKIAMVWGFIVVVAIAVMGNFVVGSLSYATPYELLVVVLMLGWVVSGRNMYIYMSLGIAAAVALMGIASTSAFHASEYQQIIKKGETSAYNHRLDRPRILTRTMAAFKAKKVLGQKVGGNNLSSQFELGDGSLVLKNEDFVWVFPLEPRSIWKWMDLSGSVGYVEVDPYNADKAAKLVKHEMKYTHGGFFHEDIERVVWMASGAKNFSTHFEVNDLGEPYWVSSVYKKGLWVGKEVVDYVILTDAKSGVSTTYSLDSTPAWVDKIYSEEYINKAVKLVFSLEGGWLNSMFGGANVLTTTSYNDKELWLFEQEGELYYITGLTSPGSTDDSLVSILSVNARTGEYSTIEVVGQMDEEGAVTAMESNLGVNSMKWGVVLPQPRMIDGNLYWLGVVKSRHQAVFQKVVAIDASNPSKVIFADRFSELKLENLKIGNVVELNGEEKVEISLKLYRKLIEIRDLLKNN